MSKSKVGQKALNALSELLTFVQNRAFWLSDEFRKLADKVDVIAQKQRSDTAILQSVNVHFKGQLDQIAAAFNRLRFEFDHSRAGQNTPIAEIQKSVENLSQLHTTLRRDFEVHRADAEGLIDSAAKAAGTVAGEKFMELTETLRAEVDRLRNLQVSRTNVAVEKYQELEAKVVQAMQAWNERISKLEGAPGPAWHLAVGVEKRVQALESLPGTSVVVTARLLDLERRVKELEQPREIRLLVAAPVNNPPNDDFRHQ